MFAEAARDWGDAKTERWSSDHREWVVNRPIDAASTYRSTRAWMPPTSRIVAAFRRGIEDPAVRKHIKCNPRVQGGTPTYSGTRIPAYVTLELLSDVTSFARVLKEFPELTRAHLLAALRLAAAALSL